VITLEGAFAAEPADAAGKSRANGAPEIFLLVLPGVAVYALFLVGDQGMRDLLAETAGGTLRRQLAGPIGAPTLLLGKVMYTAVLSSLALVVLAGVGAAIGRAGTDPLGFLILSLALILAVTGAAATVYGFARTERLGSTVSSLVYLVFGMTGGSFFPLDSLPASMRAIAPLSPFYWGSQGFRKLLAEGAGLGGVLPNVAVLAGLGVLLLAIGAGALGRAVRRGAAA
jgi:ABC-2 type transport system permease protein